MTDSEYGQLLAALKKELQSLPDKPEESPVATLKALWLTACGNAKSAQLAEGMELPALTSEQRAALNKLIEYRLKGIPLAHITGRQNFMGVELLTGRGALIPRKETELLAKTALGLIRNTLKSRDNAIVVDVCTGAGNLPIAYAVHEPSIHVYAADLSADAVELARQNIQFQNLQGRVEIFQGDLLEPFDNLNFYKKVDVLTCNPPYISSAKVENMHEEISDHEPKMAFDGGPFGIRILQKLIQQAPRYLRKGGWLAFEVGLGQGPVMMKRMSSGKNESYFDIQSVADENGNVRVVLARI